MPRSSTHRLRVAAVPAGHPYARHLLALEDDGPVLALPDPDVPGAPPGQWWPPVVLTPAWVRENAGSVDVVHLHFGTESCSAGELAAWLAACRRHGLPVVYTVHDLSNPQVADSAEATARHRAQLDVLVPGADALVTLTGQTAELVDRTWGRRPTVIAHPHVWGLQEPWPADLPEGGLVLGVHLRDLRPNIDALGTVATMLVARDRLVADGVPTRVRVVRDVATRRPELAAAVDELLRAGGAERVVVPRLDDRALAASLSRADVEVLPYARGTHSGWLELCWDLGVAVVAPGGVGAYLDQHPGDPSVAGYRRADGGDLARAVAHVVGAAAGAAGGAAASAGLSSDAVERGRRARASLRRRRRTDRVAQRSAVASAHHAVYLAVCRQAGPEGTRARAE